MLHERDPAHVVHECRHCGTTLESATDTCPVCDSSAVARYVIE
jgi:rubrerythrin